MSKQGSNSELFAHENNALTARPQQKNKCYNRNQRKYNMLYNKQQQQLR